MPLIPLLENLSGQGSSPLFRVLLAPTPILGKWVVLYTNPQEGSLIDFTTNPSPKEVGTGMPVEYAPGVVPRMTLSQNVATITIQDTEDILTVGPDSSEVRGLSDLLKMYPKDLLENYQQWLKNSVWLKVEEGKDTGGAHPIFLPNSLVVVENWNVESGRWLPVFLGVVDGVSTTISKGTFLRQIDISVRHPFEILNSLDMFHTFFFNLTDPYVLEFRNTEEEALYWAQVVGQYPRSILEKVQRRMTSDFRSFRDILLYLNLADLLRFISIVGNIRLFAGYLNESEVDYDILDRFGIPHPPRDRLSESDLVSVYNGFVQEYSPLGFLENRGLFGQDISVERVPQLPTLEQFPSAGEFHVVGNYLPVEWVMDERIENGYGVEHIFQGLLSFTVDIYYKKGSGKKVSSVLNLVQQATFLQMYPLPSGKVAVVEPKSIRSNLDDENVVVSTVLESDSKITVSTASLAGFIQTWGGVDLIPEMFSNKLVSRKTLYRFMLDPKLFVRSGARETVAPTVYWNPDMIGTQEWEQLIQSYLHSHLILHTASHYSSTITIQGTVPSISVLHLLGTPVVLVEQGWVFTLDGWRMEYSAGRKMSTTFSLSYGRPIGEKPEDVVFPYEVLRTMVGSTEHQKEPTEVPGVKDKDAEQTVVQVKRPPSDFEVQVASRTSPVPVDISSVSDAQEFLTTSSSPMEVVEEVVKRYGVGIASSPRSQEVVGVVKQALEQTGVLNYLKGKWSAEGAEPELEMKVRMPRNYPSLATFHPYIVLKGIRIIRPKINLENWNQEESGLDFIVVPVSGRACNQADEMDIQWDTVAFWVASLLSQKGWNVNQAICEYMDENFNPEWEVQNGGEKTAWVYYDSVSYELFFQRRLGMGSLTTPPQVGEFAVKWGNLVTILPSDIRSRGGIRIAWTL